MMSSEWRIKKKLDSLIQILFIPPQFCMKSMTKIHTNVTGVWA